MLTLARRDWTVFLAIAIAFCVAFLVEPDWHLQEAHRLCPGQPVQVFESMTACAVNQPTACPCSRPQNPWVIAYWLVFLSGVGAAAALLVRARWLLSGALLAVAMAVGGYSGILLLSRHDSFEPEAWGYVPFVLSVYVSIALVAFGLVRLTRHFLLKRPEANA